jgi:hypothetical protein
VLVSNITISKLSKSTRLAPRKLLAVDVLVLFLFLGWPNGTWRHVKLSCCLLSLHKAKRRLARRFPFRSDLEIFYRASRKPKVYCNVPIIAKWGTRLNLIQHPHGISDESVYGLNFPSFILGLYLTLLLTQNWRYHLRLCRQCWNYSRLCPYSWDYPHFCPLHLYCPILISLTEAGFHGRYFLSFRPFRSHLHFCRINNRMCPISGVRFAKLLILLGLDAL